MYKFSDTHQAYREGYNTGWKRGMEHFKDSARKLEEIDRLTLGYSNVESPLDLFEVITEIRKVLYSTE